MILAVGTYGTAGGLNTITRAYMKSFERESVDVRWILFGTEGAPPDIGNHLYVRLSDGWNFYIDPKSVDQAIVSQVRNWLEELKPKFIFRPLEYSYGPYMDSSGIPEVTIAQLLRIPLIASAGLQKYFLSKQVMSGVNADVMRLPLEHQTFSAASVIVSNSKTTMQGLQRHYPDHFEKHRLCSPLGAEDEFFEAPPLAVSKNAFYCGRLNHQKGIPHLLRDVPPGWRLSMAGRGKWTPEEMMKFGIEPLDWLDGEDLRAQLFKSTFCLFPSHYEPWGLSLTEALAAGRICIAQKNAGGHEEQIRHGENGFLIDFGAQNFWEVLYQLYSGPRAELLEVSARARSGARRWHTHATEVLALLKAL